MRGLSKLLIVLALAANVSSLHGNDESPPVSDPERPPTTVGSVTGKVRLSSATRGWRQARYYVDRRNDAALAEAVVAVRRASTSAQPTPTSRHRIDQKNFQFTPETIAIRRGDSVEFTNSDSETHNVRSTSPLARFNRNTTQGGNYVHRFEQAGGLRRPVVVGCVYHGAMRAWVFVFDHPYYHVTKKDGTFRFDALPEGRIELEVFHPAGGMRERIPVVIEAGRTVTVDVLLTRK